ncbi:UDP-N-acetylmuramoyl-L-alanine--D-glutamate ligase [Bacillus thermotolerans]|uniref:UDP-N-acetylmuramoylalanine--D-glutamate ligase n=1 Tax=Bacillus thermotolerans TaxID=1221996 RepID=A0A0F5I9R6_BACTR|nr:UDP-N-acetylmuramoyl-L-alanine--D-glutamate ligase [Bacillus thermotolerans]KKB39255.1 UDP-N-acetylmuramoylalanine--D-glutamate ligase [Bacillus thermotolerans]KKB42271.1 UDP-N-acetylmuramoylalanine--D-glutamate ligase [Bacillus thermotolerans]
MKTITTFQHKKVLVLGLAKSGVSAALLLHKLGAFVTVNDYKPLNENPEAQHLLEQGITVICGSHPIELLDEGFEWIVKNPGIPYHNPIVSGAVDRGIPVLTEVELAYLISEAPFIGITGTNGKTTTTTLIHKMIQADERKAILAGNIGEVASEVVQTAEEDDHVVIELSSFQLLGIDQFRPRIAVITNLYDAHLDYHGTKEEYAKAKLNITKNQTEEDYFIVNADQQHLMELASSTKATIVPFSTVQSAESGACVKEGMVYFRDEAIISLQEIVLPGAHNLENILAAVSAVKLSGVSNEAIRQVLTTFEGVRHRTQFVREWNGRRFYNDSKATNTLATKSALNAFESPIVLLAGGLDRGNGFDDLIPYMSNVKALITFGETADKLEETARKAGVQIVVKTENMQQAVQSAYKHSSEGDVILLSPACASWDQYKTFEQRGDIFIEAVHTLK